jgi:hypothetical protein
LDLGVFDY